MPLKTHKHPFISCFACHDHAPLYLCSKDIKVIPLILWGIFIYIHAHVFWAVLYSISSDPGDMQSHCRRLVLLAEPLIRGDLLHFLGAVHHTSKETGVIKKGELSINSKILHLSAGACIQLRRSIRSVFYRQNEKGQFGVDAFRRCTS